MWKLIVNETQGWRFHPNGSEYADVHNPCVGSQLAYNCIDEYGSFGRLACYACTPELPCLYDVLRDPSETDNMAQAMPVLVHAMQQQLAALAQPYVPSMPAAALACYNCSFDPKVLWGGYVGPGCLAVQPNGANGPHG
jgi:hypothetical protein